MPHTEYREILQLSAVRFFREDLLRLLALLTNVEGFTQIDSKLSATFKSKTINANDVDALLAAITEEHTDRLSIETVYWSGSHIDASVSLTLSKNYCQCQLHSEDAEWFYGTQAQIREFFRECRA